MVDVRRGQIWWTTLPESAGSGPGFRRPVAIVQSNPFNASRIQTVVVAAITSNLRLAEALGNIKLSQRESGLSKPSVVNVDDGPEKCSGLPVQRYNEQSLHREFGAPFSLLGHEHEMHETPFGTRQSFLYCYCRVHHG